MGGWVDPWPSPLAASSSGYLFILYFHPCPSHVLRWQRGPGNPIRGGLGCCGCCSVGPSLLWPLLGREMPLEDGDSARWRGQQQVNGEVSGAVQLGRTGEPPLRDTPAPRDSRPEVMAERREPGPALVDGDATPRRVSGQAGQHEEALMAELSELVQKVVRSSSWWERHGLDISILACSILLLPPGKPAQPPQTRAEGIPREGEAAASSGLIALCAISSSLSLKQSCNNPFAQCHGAP